MDDKDAAEDGNAADDKGLADDNDAADYNRLTMEMMIATSMATIATPPARSALVRNIS
jgi:hypothetical protein